MKNVISMPFFLILLLTGSNRAMNKEESLILACRQGNVENVQNIINNGVDINYQDAMKNCPLHYAALFGRIEIAKTLTKNHANLQLKNHANHTPLHNAASHNQSIIAEHLLRKGADVNAQDAYKTTPLHLTIAKGFNTTTNVLIKFGANVNLQNNEGETPLHFAASENTEDTTNSLLENNALIHTLNRENRHPLLLALKANNPTIVKDMLCKGLLDNSFKNTYEAQLPKLQTLCSLHSDVLNQFLTLSNLDLTNDVKMSIIREHAKIMALDELKDLIKKLPKKHKKELISVIINTLCANHIEKLKVLLSQEDDYGKTALSIAEKRNHPEIMGLIRNIMQAENLIDLDYELQNQIANWYEWRLNDERALAPCEFTPGQLKQKAHSKKYFHTLK